MNKKIVTKVPYFKAKMLHKDMYIDGYFFQQPEIQPSPIGCPLKPIKMRYFLVCKGFADWNMKIDSCNIYEIDINTLEKIDDADVIVDCEDVE